MQWGGGGFASSIHFVWYSYISHIVLLSPPDRIMAAKSRVVAPFLAPKHICTHCQFLNDDQDLIKQTFSFTVPYINYEEARGTVPSPPQF